VPRVANCSAKISRPKNLASTPHPRLGSGDGPSVAPSFHYRTGQTTAPQKRDARGTGISASWLSTAIGGHPAEFGAKPVGAAGRGSKGGCSVADVGVRASSFSNDPDLHRGHGRCSANFSGNFGKAFGDHPSYLWSTSGHRVTQRNGRLGCFDRDKRVTGMRAQTTARRRKELAHSRSASCLRPRHAGRVDRTHPGPEARKREPALWPRGMPS
jgi:hypothetical protein